MFSVSYNAFFFSSHLVCKSQSEYLVRSPVQAALASFYTCISIKYTALNCQAIAQIWPLDEEIPTGHIRGAEGGGLAMYGHSELEIWRRNRGGIYLLAP